MKQEILRIEDLCAETEQGIRLSHINLNLFKRETIALMEVNGSGETVLIDILCGRLSSLKGKIYINEKLTNLSSEDIASRNGIYKISRNTGLIDDLTIAENIFIVRRNSFKKVFVNKNLIFSETAQLLSKVGLKLNPNICVGQLSRAEKHLVELAKAIGSGAEIVIFDRNFYSYTTDELIKLEEVLVNLKNDGVSFIICCDYIEEVRLFSEKVIFFRDGEISKKISTLELNADMMKDYMIGGSFNTLKIENSVSTEDVAFEVDNLVLNESAPPIHFNLKHGETVAFLDIDTLEREKLFCLLSGREKQSGMSLLLNGKLLNYKNLHGLLAKRIVSIRSLGLGVELLNNLSIEENILLPSLKKASSVFGFVSSKLTKLQTDGITKKFLLNKHSVKELDRNGRIAVLLERWYIYHPELVIMLDPFLLCDIVSENLICDFMRKLTKEGTSIILIASRDRKLKDKCDRILAVENGKIYDKTNMLDAMRNLIMEDAK